MTVPSGTSAVSSYEMACCVWGSKSCPSGVHRGDAFGFEQGPKLAVDGADAFDPGAVLDIVRNVRHGQVEVVRKVEHAHQQPVAGDRCVLRAFFSGAPLEVGEVGPSALPAGFGLRGPLLGDLQLTGELLELLGHASPLVVERRDALLGARSLWLRLGRLGLFGSSVGLGALSPIGSIVHAYR